MAVKAANKNSKCYYRTKSILATILCNSEQQNRLYYQYLVGWVLVVSNLHLKDKDEDMFVVCVTFSHISLPHNTTTSASKQQITYIYWLIPGFYPPWILWSTVPRSPYKMNAPDRHNGQSDKRTCLFIRLTHTPSTVEVRHFSQQSKHNYVNYQSHHGYTLQQEHTSLDKLHTDTVIVRDVPVPVGRISGHFLISGSGSGQNGTKNRISEPDIDWSFLAVSSPIESVTGIVITVH